MGNYRTRANFKHVFPNMDIFEISNLSPPTDFEINA